jgi:uncharacterized membrane protein YbhN (UPF0104 family)
MPRLGAGVRRALRLSVTAALAAYIAAVVDLGSVGQTLGRVHPGAIGAALALYVLGQGLSACKWALIGRSVGLQRPLTAYTRFYFIGMFFNLVGPSTVGGDLARGLYLGEGRRPGLALNSVLFDRLSGLALLMALGAGALLVFPEYGLPGPLTTVLVAGGVALVLGWWTCPRLVRLLPAGNRVRRLVETDLAPFWGDRRLLGRVAAMALVFHLSQVCVQFLLARAAGVAVPFSYCLVYHPVVSVMAALPISVAGLGVREGGYIYFLTRIGIDDAVAVTVGLLWFAISVLAGLLGGLLFVASGAALPPLPRTAVSSS